MPAVKKHRTNQRKVQWMSKSKTTTPATSVVESVSPPQLGPRRRETGITTTSVKIAKRRGTSALNSNPTTETTMTIDNFFGKPVGAAVLFLNGFHFGKRLNDLNRCARLVPDDVKGYASIVASTPQAGPATVELAIDQLVSWADDAQKIHDMNFKHSFKHTLPFVSMRTAYDYDIDKAENVEMDTEVCVDPEHNTEDGTRPTTLTQEATASLRKVSSKLSSTKTHKVGIRWHDS